MPLNVTLKDYTLEDGLRVSSQVFDTDEGVRPDTTVEVSRQLAAGIPGGRYGHGGQCLPDE